ncbi:MAG: pyruvate ferredoxin oxidoreductase [Candidatus Thermoplasmatota archaeon]
MPKEMVKGNFATAVAAKLARAEVVPAYPITPSTLFPEQISEFVANGEMETQFVPVESEHSAMSACIGASAAGARTCTATSSQGLALMHEVLFIASGMRLPIVMAVANRALSAPINIWGDHSDTMAERDAGWIHFYAERNQEALDLMLIGFKVAEDKRVLLPAMVGLDAFVLTHTIEPVDIPEQTEVDLFLPRYSSPYCTLDPAHPMTIGSFATPEHYMEFKLAQERAISRASLVIDEVLRDFEKRFGRRYQKVSGYRTDDAEIILLTIGSMTGTARVAVEELRAQGNKVGAAKLTVYRPFPHMELHEILRRAKAVAVVERAYSYGCAGPLYSDLGGAFCNMEKRPLLLNYVIGLGGRDIVVEDFKRIYADASAKLASGKPQRLIEWIDVDHAAVEEVE